MLIELARRTRAKNRQPAFNVVSLEKQSMRSPVRAKFGGRML